jgi:CRP-like cAMP-binding protein
MNQELAPATPANRLLALLPRADYQRLRPHLHPVTMGHGQVLYEARSAIDFAYFPVGCVCSALTVMSDGSAIEVATVGAEGAVGVGALVGVRTSPNKVIVQIEDGALRLGVDVLLEEGRRDGPLRTLLLNYQAAFMAQVSQSVACNGLHHVQQRCCRWLLMTHDRVGSDVIPLTHEFLAIMLGVRRPGVTEVLQDLKGQGLLTYSRGKITVLDRRGLEAVSCECYQSVNDEYERLLG